MVSTIIHTEVIIKVTVTANLEAGVTAVVEVITVDTVEADPIIEVT